MAMEMLINVVENEECRIAIMRGSELEGLYMERASVQRHVGNIYKGRVNNIEPSIQAAFVDIGMPKNGFLHASDVIPRAFPDRLRKDKAKKNRRHRQPIQEIFRPGDDVVVQITKEGIGTKGPSLTTALSIPGRYLVLMPHLGRLGVSRKIEKEPDRKQLRDLLADLKPSPDLGFIVRTAGLGRSKREIQRDLNYLARLWEVVKARAKSDKAPAEIFRESDLVLRTLRDVYNPDIQTIWVDSETVLKRVSDFMKIVMPRYQNRYDIPFSQLFYNNHNMEKNCGLTNSCQGQFFHRPFYDDMPNVISKNVRSMVKELPRLRIRINYFFRHSYILRSLAGEKKCSFSYNQSVKIE